MSGCGACHKVRVFMNATQAAGRVVGAVVKRRSVFVPEATKANRLKVCDACEQLDGSRCVECGCFVKTKASLTTETCRKWPDKK